MRSFRLDGELRPYKILFSKTYKRNEMMQMRKDIISGIYCIENLTTNKKYIGQSRNINDRWYRHRKELNDGIHDNDYLQKNKSFFSPVLFLLFKRIFILQLKFYSTLSQTYFKNDDDKINCFSLSLCSAEYTLFPVGIDHADRL